MPIAPPPTVPPEVHQLAAELADIQPMRRGSLSERAIRCGKPGCACAEDPKSRHGPYFSLTRAVGGKTRSRFLTPEQAVIARQQIDAGRSFRDRADAYWDACEQWADRELAATSKASPKEAKKKGSKLPSKTRSSKKSKH